MSTAANSVRKNVMLNEGSAARLEYVKNRAELASDTDAIRFCIRHTKRLMELQLDGYAIQLVRDGEPAYTYEPLAEALVKASA